MTKDEIDALRVRIALEPEGSPAKQLLAELDRRTAQKETEDDARTLAMLRGPSFWLTEMEAQTLHTHLKAGGKLEKEEGTCRRCNGERRVLKQSHCFGHEDQECPSCHGDGIDDDRVKVPGLREVAVCECPDWWNDFYGKNIRSNSKDKKETGLWHYEKCPKRRAL